MTKNILEWGWHTSSPNSSSSDTEWKPATTLLGGADPKDLDVNTRHGQTGDTVDVAQLRCEGMRGGGGCSSGGNYGATATHQVEGRKLCVSCAVKAIGAEGLPSTEQTEMLKPFCARNKDASIGTEVTEREIKLRKLDAGDIFHASASNGASLICLTLRATKFSIHAKRITTQTHHAFDPVTGIEQNESVPSIIDSVALLPPDILEALLGLEQVYSKGWQEEHHKLTSEEKRALLFIGGFYKAHPLPT